MTAAILNPIARSNLSFVAQSTIQVLFGRLYNQPSYGGLSFDLISTEDHVYNSQVSSFPVQSGSTIIDNVIKTPTSVRIKALVSDTPYRLFESQLEAIGRVKDIVTSGNVGLRSLTAMEALVKLQETRQPATLVTGIKVYPNMVLTKMSVPRDNKTGQALWFDLEFKEVLLASVQLAVQAFDPATIVSADSKVALKGDAPTSIRDQFSRVSNFGTQTLRAINVFKNGAIGSLLRFLA